MPTYGHAAFLARAVESLLGQTYAAWELVVVDDGSPDDTEAVVRRFAADPRVRSYRHAANEGLGAALNTALECARGELVAYLPSDDVYHPEHLATLVATLDANPDAVLAFSGVRHTYNRTAPGAIEGEALQLVQVMHRAGPERWVTRDEIVTDDLDAMFWDRLRLRGDFAETGRVSCEWVDHPHQRHKILREALGGINKYRDAYRVAQPLRFRTTVGNLIDEVDLYARYRERADTPAAADGLKILLVGELAYNADRVLALEERGHRLYGLWMPEPMSLNTVGPLPFGHVTDIPRDGWRAAVRDIRPDVIYALLNWQAVPFAHAVMRDNPGIPFVWHFKEGPFICLEKGMWRELFELTTQADGRIYSSAEQAAWMETTAPSLRGSPTLVLDGDLPKRDWLDAPRSPRLSGVDGEVHTVVPGRPIGLHPPVVGELAAAGVHLHFYGDFTQGLWRNWIVDVGRLAPRHFHLHPQVNQDRWATEFSRYDAGWLHCFESENGGDLTRANWDDLNLPARIATLAVAGLPMIQRRNDGAIVATQNLAREHDIGVFFSSVPELAERLHDRETMTALAENVLRSRDHFTFDAHVDRLVAFMRSVISGAAAPAGG